MNIIKTHNLSLHFGGVKAINNLSIEIPANKTTCLIGPNGSGKTTLLNILCGLLKPMSGEIEISSQKFSSINPTKLRDLKIARTFQDGRVINQMSVIDNLLLPVAKNNPITSLTEVIKYSPLAGESKSKDESLQRLGEGCDYNRRLHQVLRTTKLYEKKDDLADNLSYGQRKLLEIGRVLMQDADIYFFDEPFTGLFNEIVVHVMDILKDLHKQGKTIVIIEHNMELVKKLCDHSIVLDSGKLLAEGTPTEVFKNAKVQEAYLGI